MAKARSSTTVRSFSKLIPGAALLVAAAIASAPSWARTDAEVQHAVQTMIMNRHPGDTPQWWRALGPGAPAVIMRMYGSVPSTYHRMRLLEGLGAFPDDAAAKAFVQKQAEGSAEQVVRNAAIRAIARNAPSDQGAEVEEWLSRFLVHADPHTRLLAAEMLRERGTPSGAARAAEHMASERITWVVSAFKGEAPKMTAPLKPSGSSEDRLSADLAGVWKGYWIEPKKGSAGGMSSRAVELRLAVAGVDQLNGTLRLMGKDQGKSKIRSYALSSASGQAARWRGVLVGEAGERTPVEGELKRRAGSLILEVRATQGAETLILRRD